MTRSSRTLATTALAVFLALAVALLAGGAPAHAERAGHDPIPYVAGEALDSGGSFVCAAGSRSRLVPQPPQGVWCWGQAYLSQLGPDSAAKTGRAAESIGPIASLTQTTPSAPVLDVAVGERHICLLRGAAVTCWGPGTMGNLGYGNTSTVGDDEQPGDAGPVDVGAAALGVTAGEWHTCALLQGGAVRCWGWGANGRLGSGTTTPQLSAGIRRSDPAAHPPVDLGVGRAALSVSAGFEHSCAVLDGGDVRCWGAGADGRLGRGSTADVGDDETPGSVPPVDLGRPAVAVSSGTRHTCAILDDRSVRCWGAGADGRLGYGNLQSIGDDEPPASAGAVPLGQPAKSISAGKDHTCAVLADATVRCWGLGADGRLGYGNTASVGDDETPASAGPVDVGAATRSVVAGSRHTCADLGGSQAHQVRCWGRNGFGVLGFGDGPDVGDNETPSLQKAVFPSLYPAVSGPPPPQRGATASAVADRGKVLVQTTPGGRFRRLRKTERIPIGSVLETTKGSVLLTTAANGKATQSGRFWGGRFRLGQSRTSPLTTLTLVGKRACPARRASRGEPRTASPPATTRAKARKPGRAKAKRGNRVWGDASGLFETKGDLANASSKGTRWLLEEWCDGTVVRVARGRISVRDKVRRQTFPLKADRTVFIPKRTSAKRTNRVPPRR